MHRIRLLCAAPLLAAVALTAACASGGPATDRPSSSSAAVPVSPSSPGGPSAASLLTCSADATGDIRSVLGTDTTQPPRATWSDHLYSCPYHYGPATMLVSVKELPDAAAVTAYFEGARKAADRATVRQGLGEQAFTVADGSVYVRKDLTVLHIDVSALPARFGTPSRTPTQVALTVATTILICWKEA